MMPVNPALAKPAQAAPDPTVVDAAVRAKLPFAARLASLAPLPGDASNRRYFRVTLENSTIKSLILMQLAEPEAFKASEEAVSGAGVAIDELPFINVRNHLARAEVAVPALYYYDQPGGLLYLEDFGDVLLSEACRGTTGKEIQALYEDAVDSLARLHRNATTPPDHSCIAFHRAFDVPLLMWEFDHFFEYGIVARQGRPMCADDAAIIRTEFQKIAELVAAQPRVFTHRDYHARNLMVRNERLNNSRFGILDFQDALMGPAAYDLASLLRDAYIALDETLIDDLIERYVKGMEGSSTIVSDRAAFRWLFDLTSIQRNLKAAGRFVYIDRVKHNPKFLADIPRVLGYVRRNLEKHPGLATLRKHLTPYVPELQ